MRRLSKQNEDRGRWLSLNFHSADFAVLNFGRFVFLSFLFCIYLLFYTKYILFLFSQLLNVFDLPLSATGLLILAVLNFSSFLLEVNH